MIYLGLTVELEPLPELEGDELALVVVVVVVVPFELFLPPPPIRIKFLVYYQIIYVEFSSYN